MLITDAKEFDYAFVSGSCLMFSDLIAKLASDTELAPTRKRDMTSGLRRISNALGLPPEDVPIDARWLQPRLAKIAPAAIGLTPKSWQNAVSDARSAMAHFGIVERRHNNIKELTTDWRELWEIVLRSGDPTLQPSLQRFVYFLGHAGIKPGKVHGEHAIAYRDALSANEISRSPEVAYRAAVNGWNLAVQRIPEWPRRVLPLTSRQIVFKLPDTAFALGFRQELDTLMTKLSASDPLADDGRAKALRPMTIVHYRSQLIRFCL